MTFVNINRFMNSCICRKSSNMINLIFDIILWQGMTNPKKGIRTEGANPTQSTTWQTKVCGNFWIQKYEMLTYFCDLKVPTFCVPFTSLYCRLATTSGEGMLKELLFEINHLSWILDFNFESTITLISERIWLFFISFLKSLNIYIRLSLALSMDVKILTVFTLLSSRH